MEKVLVKFKWDCGRMGNVSGLFVTTNDELKKSYGKRVYFGEILGKHSEIDGTLDKQDIEVKSKDQYFIGKLVEVIGSENIAGYNPLEYILESEDEEK